MARPPARRRRTPATSPAPAAAAAPAPAPFNLDRFEHLALSRHQGDVEQAFGLLHQLLAAMEKSRGSVPAGLSTQRPPGGPATPELERLTLLWTRIAHAISGLFLHPAFETLNLDGLWQLLLLHKQLASIFHASSLETADACILAFDRAEPGQPFTIAQQDLAKVLLLYSLESRLELELITAFDQVDHRAVLFTSVALCSTPFCGSERSYRRREQLLRYLCHQLEQHQLEEQALHLLTISAYMYCSYASSADKHAIKGLIHRQWRRRLADQGLTDLVQRGAAWPQPGTTKADAKPVLLILHEWLATGSAMHRCYANWIAALRQHFHTVGMGLKQGTGMDPEALALFDSYVPLPEGVPIPQTVRAIWSWCQQHQPAAVYYPSIGMGPHTVAAASIRLAPLQLMTQGHPATTGGSCIDVLVSAADYAYLDGELILDRSLVEEQLVLVPPGAMTWLTPGWEGGPSRERAERQRSRIANPALVPQIVISASPMKLGAPFLELCQRIWQRTRGRAYWHFFIGEARGCLHLEIARTIRTYLGEDCKVYPHLEYKDYIKSLQVGDIFLTPFPFGNSNTLYDYFAAGLIGVNLRSGELSCSVDTCLFHRLGFPNSLIASSPSAYEDIAVRLILDSDWRQQLYHHTYDSNANHQAVFSGGDASKFADTVASLL
ncbi:MAG: hypothetical protein VKM92_03885 [Cyanobacteriota bacterium]|nr:hypothetical protein [Cyanobacteriota bacterium]